MSKFPAAIRRIVLLLGLGVAGWLWFSEGRPTHGRKAAARALPNAKMSAKERGGIAASLPPDAGAGPSTMVAPAALFSFVATAEAALLNAALPAPAHEIHYVRLNRAALVGKRSPFWQARGEGRLTVTLPRGGVVTVVIESSEMLGPDRFVSRGILEGREGGHALFAWHAGFLHAEIVDRVLGKFALRAATNEVSQFYRIAPELVAPCGGERRSPLRAAGVAPPPPDRERPLPAAVAAAENPQHAEVHVMMLYTQDVLTTLAGAAREAALQSAFDLAIARANDAFAASLITARVKLVKIAQTNYDENASAASLVQDDALTALYQEADGKMDEIHALRDAVGADVVCLALNRRDLASSGLSFLLDDQRAADNSRFAFSIVQYSNVTGTSVVPHELGHVFGCAHDRENATTGSGAFSFSYGYRFFGADGRQYRDIMAYPPGSELNYFSNPKVTAITPIDRPLGIAGGFLGESDTAMTIERTAFATAGYRLQTQTPAAAGTLINVATRAFVGTGDAVMIGGFVVRGPQAKEILIRAAGPGLAGFGVSDALADPMLRIFAGGTMLAENDNWSTPAAGQAAAGVISAAAVRAGAFPFSSGSADAAVLVTLPPGPYTAIVEGARGTTGVGLVEAYETSANTTKIVNLATRALVGRDSREMTGGFVVQGDAGSTKRILIRVLGPTLGRAPFNL
ncbi:MAG: M12 family metallo-peptidase, partial [Opitutaceae bacterium]